LFTFIPPKLYTLESNALGGIYWPVAHISDLKIDSIGTTRNISDFSSQAILIPEAYKVTIVFKELLPQSSNIFDGSIGGRKIEVTGNFQDVLKPTQQAVINDNPLATGGAQVA